MFDVYDEVKLPKLGDILKIDNIIFPGVIDSLWCVVGFIDTAPLQVCIKSLRKKEESSIWINYDPSFQKIIKDAHLLELLKELYGPIHSQKTEYW